MGRKATLQIDKGVRRHHYEDAFFVFSFYYPVCDVPCLAVKVDAYLGNWLLA